MFVVPIEYELLDISNNEVQDNDSISTLERAGGIIYLRLYLYIYIYIYIYIMYVCMYVCH